MLSSTRRSRGDGDPALGWWRRSTVKPILALALTTAASSLIHVVGAFHIPPPVCVQARLRCISRSSPQRVRRTYALHSSKTDEVVSGTNQDIDQSEHEPLEIKDMDVSHLTFHNSSKGDLHTNSHIAVEEAHVAEATNNSGVSSVTSKEDINATETGSSAKKNGTPASKILTRPLSHRQKAGAPMFMFPWSFWMKIRSTIPIIHHEAEGTSNTGNLKPKRRWEVPLTSKPFQGVDELRSTIMLCIGAIALYFAIGTLAIPLWLEPSWSFIDALYYSMASLTTVGYGDVVIRGGTGIRGMMAKLFVLSFNVYAVCISVSALGIIAKLALAQERKLETRAKERARQLLMNMFDSDQENDEEEDEGVEDRDDEEDEEQCQWADRVFDEKKNCDFPDEPRSIFGALMQALKSNHFNFLILAFMAGLLQRIEGWSFIDVLYYWNCTATTIGFGDICPKSQLGRLLAIGFVPLSVVTLGEVIASVFAYVNGRIAAKAEKDFLRREITFSDLDYLDVNDDGRVCKLDFISFMLVAMQKVDRSTMKDLQRLFDALDVSNNGFIDKSDLVELRQRKRLSKRLRRDRRKNKERWFETKMRKDPKKSKKWFGWSF